MKICFSCRVAHDEDALMLKQDSDLVCASCYHKWMEDRGDENTTTFANWRQDVALERFGFDPYMERETSILLHARDATALFPLSRECLDKIDQIRDVVPTMDPTEIMEQALDSLIHDIEEIQQNARERANLAQMIGLHVAMALRDGSGE